MICHGTKLVGTTAAILMLITTCSVIAFVAQQQQHHPFTSNIITTTVYPSRPPYCSVLRASTDNLKGLLDASSYENDVVKAYAGKTIKTAAKKASKTSASSPYDLTVDDSITSSAAATTTSPSEPSSVVVDTITSADTVSATISTPPPTMDSSPPISEQIESMTQSVKEALGKSTNTGGDAKNPLDGISVPSNVQDAMEKPFTSLNNVLKSTQDSIKEAQRVAAEQSAAVAAGSGTSGASSSPAKVPTMADYMFKSFDRKANLGVVTEKKAIDIKVPEIALPEKLPDVKFPDMPTIQMPSMDQVAKFTPPPASTTGPPVSVRMTEITLPEPGKALTFGEYVRAKAAGALPDDGTSNVSTIADIKAKFGIMVANYYKLIGEEVPESLDDVQFPTMQDLANLSNKVTGFDWERTFNNLPENAPWGAVALGTFLVVAGARSNAPAAASVKKSKKVEAQTMEAATKALGSLTEDLESLQGRMKVLEQTGLSLQKELKDAKEKLLEKELEISKERLKVADNKLTLNREVQKLEQKLKDNGYQVKSLDKELAITRDESEALRKELVEVKETSSNKLTEEMEIAKKAVVPESATIEELPSAEDVKEKEVSAPKKKAATKKKKAVKKIYPVEELVAEAVPKSAPDEDPAVDEAPKKVATKKVATKKTAAKKKGVAKTKVEPPIVFFAEEVKAPDSASKKKAATKKSAAKKTSKGASDDWSSLSKSTLTRKTVKEMTEYLDSKGVATTDPVGNPLKKADMVEVILSL